MDGRPWGVHRPQRNQQQQDDESGPSSRQLQHENFPMEEGDIGSEKDQDSSVLEVPTVNGAKNVGVKNVQYIKMGHAPKWTQKSPSSIGTCEMP